MANLLKHIILKVKLQKNYILKAVLEFLNVVYLNKEFLEDIFDDLLMIH